MRLTDKEIERLNIFMAAELSRKRKKRGLMLNYVESLALICDEILEAVREGKSYNEVLYIASNVLKKDEVMDGVADLINLIQIEAVFQDGTKLVTIRNPIQ